jgi:hypothetical protein
VKWQVFSSPKSVIHKFIFLAVLLEAELVIRVLESSRNSCLGCKLPPFLYSQAMLAQWPGSLTQGEAIDLVHIDRKEGGGVLGVSRFGATQRFAERFCRSCVRADDADQCDLCVQCAWLVHAQPTSR